MQAQIGRHDGQFKEDSVLNKSRYTDQRQLRCFLSPRLCAPGQARDNAAQWAFGGVGFISNSTDVNDQAKVVLTWAHGNNELKGGVSYDRIKYTDAQDYTGSDITMRFTRNGGHCTADPATACGSDADCVAPDTCTLVTPAGGTLNTPCVST